MPNAGASNFSGGGNFGLPDGSILKGTIKSFSAAKGYGFIMTDEGLMGASQSGFSSSNPEENVRFVRFTRDTLEPQLATSDVAGVYVQFELFRTPDRKFWARNIRALGAVQQRPTTGFSSVPPSMPMAAQGCPGMASPSSMMMQSMGMGIQAGMQAGYAMMMGMPGAMGMYGPRPGMPGMMGLRPGMPGMVRPGFGPAVPGGMCGFAQNRKRDFSPHAGSRAIAEAVRGGGPAGAGGVPGAPPGQPAPGQSGWQPEKPKSKSRSESSSSSSSSTPEVKRKKKKKKKKKKKRDRSSSEESSERSESSARSRSRSPHGTAGGEAPSPPADDAQAKEINEAKKEALEKLMALQKIEPMENRIKEWRALLRIWHPDKNPDKKEVATAVFQFLQKGKTIVNPKG